MKILFLVQLPPPIHGASSINLSIFNSKLLNGMFSTHFVNISPALQIDDIGRASLRKLFKTLMICVKSIQGYFRLRPDFVYMTLSPTGLALYKDAVLALSFKLIGAKLIFHMHGKGIHNASTKSAFKNLIYKQIFSKSNVIHLSDFFFSDVSKFVDRRNFFVVGNGINSDSPLPEKKNFKPIKFLFLSNFIREKGPLDLLSACEMLVDISSQFEVIMAGRFFDDSVKHEFQDFFNRSNLRNVTVIDDGVYGQEKQDLLAEAHVMILPTYNDCFPLALLEAMSARMAIISTEEGAIKDMVTNQENGLMVERQDPKSIARAMRYFIDNPEEACRMGESGYKRFLERYTFEVFEQRLCDVLLKIGNGN